MFDAGRCARITVFSPIIGVLLDKYRGVDLFRLQSDVVAVAAPGLIDDLLGSRPANELERPVFKPILGRSVSRSQSSAVMHAVGADVRAALRRPEGELADLSGAWPQVARAYLRDLVFGADPYRLQMLVDSVLKLNPRLTRTAILVGAALPGAWRPDAPVSNLAKLVGNAATYGDRRHLMGLYRRAAVSVCFTVSALVANALWLGSPFTADEPDRHILNESLRLLPLAWSVRRMASPEFHAIDERIDAGDNVLILPLLSHRDPGVWEDPDEFRPERWNGVDPDNHPGYLPFGHASERCWGRHMVMPLAERLLNLARSQGLTISPKQTSAKVKLSGLLEVAAVQVVGG